jgi:uncharacterized protein (TIGR02246 family)
MKLKSIVVLWCVLGMSCGAVRAQDAEKPRELTPAEKVAADMANAYAAAYNKGDVKALAGQFTEDAEWVDEDGNVISGREAIATTLKAAITGSPGRRISINVESVRSLTADVALEKGTTTVTEQDGRTSASSYTAVHVKQGDAWPITQLTETGAPLDGGAAEQLAELAWMIGDWVDNSEGVAVKVTVNWTKNRTFLTRSYSLVRDGGDGFAGTEVIGWDPTLRKVRSWNFDSDGGFSENIWTQDGPRWLVQVKSVLPDGTRGTAQHTIARAGDDKYKWSSANRVLDGEVLPNIDAIEIQRVK